MERDIQKDQWAEVGEKVGIDPTVLKAVSDTESAQHYRDKIAAAEKGDSEDENVRLLNSITQRTFEERSLRGKSRVFQAYDDSPYLGMRRFYSEALLDSEPLSQRNAGDVRLAACMRLLKDHRITKLTVRRGGYPIFEAWPLAKDDEVRDGDLRLRDGRIVRALCIAPGQLVNGKFTPL